MAMNMFISTTAEYYLSYLFFEEYNSKKMPDRLFLGCPFSYLALLFLSFVFPSFSVSDAIDLSAC